MTHRSSTVSLTILILDIDEHPPQFESPAYSFNVPYDSPVPAYIGTVHAVDDDLSSQFSDVRYSLVTSSESVYLDSETGVMRILVKLRKAATLYVKVGPMTDVWGISSYNTK